MSERIIAYDFTLVNTLHIGTPINTTDAMVILGNGKHGAIDPVEGLVYRVERKGEVDFLVKYVRPGKENGIYFPEISGGQLIENSFN